MRARIRDRLSGMAPWSGLIGAGTGFALQHQGLSDALHFDCNVSADGTGVVMGLIALSVVIAGGFVSWRALPAGDARSPAATLRRFIAHMSVMAALLAILGIALLMLAAAILPGCSP